MAHSRKNNSLSTIDDFIYKHWKPISIIIVLLALYFFRLDIIKLFNKYNVSGVVENILFYIAILFLISIFFLCLRIFLKNKRLIWCRFIPHLSDETNAEDIKNIISDMSKIRLKRFTRFFLGRDWKSFMVRKDSSGNYFYYFCFDKSLMVQMNNSLKKGYLNGKLEEVEIDVIEFPKKRAIGGRLDSTRYAKKRMLSFRSLKHDSLPNILNIMPLDSYYKIDFCRSDKRKVLKKIKESESDIKDVKASERTGQQKLELRNLQNRLKGSEIGFDTLISLATNDKDGADKLKAVGNSIATILENDASIYYKKYKGGVSKYPVFRPTFYMRDAGKNFLTGSELSNLVHIPNLNEESELMKKLRDSTDTYDSTFDLLEKGVFNHEDGIPVGFVKLSNGVKRIVKVSIDSIKDHLAITGKTGSGKSSFIVAVLSGCLKEHFIEEKQDVAVGLTFLDPGRDTALTLYNRLLKFYNDGGDIDWNKVNYLSIAHTDYPIALNLLDKNVGVNSDTSLSSIAEAITDIIESAVSSEAPVAKRLLSKCIETLMVDEEEHTILDVKLLVKDEAYREQILNRINKNPANFELVEYWKSDAEENLRTSEVALMNRLEVFTNSIHLKRMFGQTKTELNFRKMLDEGHINLFDMTDLNSSEMRIIGGYLSYRLYKASLGRSKQSRLHILGFDETKVLGKMPYLTRIIAETRKFKLAGLVGSQMFSQLDSELKMSLKDVQDNFISCLQGEKESREVATFLSDSRVEIKPVDLQRLNSKKREGYIALKDSIDGETNRYTLKVSIDPPVKYGVDGRIVAYETIDEKNAEEWTLTVANMRRMFRKDVKHKYEIDFNILQRMQPKKDISSYKVTEVIRLNETLEKEFNESLETLEKIRKNELVEGQVGLFYRQKQVEVQEDIHLNDGSEPKKENVLPNEEKNEKIHDDVSFHPIDAGYEEVSINPKEMTEKKKTYRISKNGLYHLSDFIDTDIDEPLEQEVINEEIHEDTFSEENTEDATEKNNVEEKATSTEKQPRRKRIKDLK